MSSEQDQNNDWVELTSKILEKVSGILAKLHIEERLPSLLALGVLIGRLRGLRGSYDRASGKSAIHRGSAWTVDNTLVLRQVKTEEKSDKITAIPQLIVGICYSRL
ncbi:MAG: hypothetical protein R3F53_07295 [Gammaproteobacteria bacterium]